MSLIYVVGLEKAVDSCTAGAMSLNEYSFYMEIFQVYVLCSIVQCGICNMASTVFVTIFKYDTTIGLMFSAPPILIL